MVNLSGKQKWCKFLVDEVHIKPAIRNHLIGSAIDVPTKAAYGWVARMLPIYSVTHEIMYDAISKVISIVHEFSGRVFLVMNDNLKANVSCFACDE